MNTIHGTYTIGNHHGPAVMFNRPGLGPIVHIHAGGPAPHIREDVTRFTPDPAELAQAEAAARAEHQLRAAYGRPAHYVRGTKVAPERTDGARLVEALAELDTALAEVIAEQASWHPLDLDTVADLGLLRSLAKAHAETARAASRLQRRAEDRLRDARTRLGQWTTRAQQLEAELTGVQAALEQARRERDDARAAGAAVVAELAHVMRERDDARAELAKTVDNWEAIEEQRAETDDQARDRVVRLEAALNEAHEELSATAGRADDARTALRTIAGMAVDGHPERQPLADVARRALDDDTPDPTPWRTHALTLAAAVGNVLPALDALTSTGLCYEPAQVRDTAGKAAEILRVAVAEPLHLEAASQPHDHSAADAPQMGC